MAVGVNNGIYLRPGAQEPLEPSKRTQGIVDRMPTLRPDMYNRVLERFKGDETRAKNWLGGYLQFWMNQIKDLIEQAAKQR